MEDVASKLDGRRSKTIVGSIAKADSGGGPFGVSQYLQWNFWHTIIASDETWLPYFNPEAKIPSMRWRRADDGPPSESQDSSSWQGHRFLGLRRKHIDRLSSKRHSINAQYYFDLLSGPLCWALIGKRPEKLGARPHAARLTVTIIADLKLPLIQAYPQDPTPSDYHPFGNLEKRGKHYSNLTKDKRNIWKRINSTPNEFFKEGMKKLIDRESALNLRVATLKNTACILMICDTAFVKFKKLCELFERPSYYSIKLHIQIVLY